MNFLNSTESQLVNDEQIIVLCPDSCDLVLKLFKKITAVLIILNKMSIFVVLMAVFQFILGRTGFLLVSLGDNFD